MARRRLRSFLAVPAVLVLAVGLTASIGLASPTAKQRPGAAAETLPQCLAELASIRSQEANLRQIRQDALHKRVYLYTVGHLEGNALFVPVSYAEFRALLTEEFLLGQITLNQAVQLVQQLKQMTLANVLVLNGYIQKAIEKELLQRTHCDALRHGSTPPPPPQPPPPSATTFTLQPGLTQVTNTHQSELTIDPTGMIAHFDNSKSSGGHWKVDYTWKVPQTITPGTSIEITLEDNILSVGPPSGPLADQMNALAPDFAQAIQAHYPDNPDVSKTFTVPIAADQKASSDIPITIGFVSSGVVYHYRK